MGMGPEDNRRRAVRSFLPRVTLFLERERVVVVAADLPEAALIVVEELDLVGPLGALPEVALRDDQAERAAVLRFERLAVVVPREQHVVVHERVDRKVGVIVVWG